MRLAINESRKRLFFSMLGETPLPMEIGANRVDGSENWANLVTPLDSGTPLIGSSFCVHLGLQIELNFVPASAKATAGKPAGQGGEWETELRFFLV